MISTVIYLIGKILTFPGAFLKGFIEHLFGRIFSIPVESAKYLRLTDGCGHIEHDLIKGKARLFFYCLLPGLVTALIGIPLFASGFMGLFYLRIPASGTTTLMFVIYCLFFFLGFSLCSNTAPLWEDARSLWLTVYGKNGANLFVKIVFFIPCLWIAAASFLEKYSLNVLLLIAITTVMGLLL